MNWVGLEKLEAQCFYIENITRSNVDVVFAIYKIRLTKIHCLKKWKYTKLLL